MKLTIELHLMLRLRMSEVICPLPLYAFMACIGTAIPLPLHCILALYNLDHFKFY
jgi:hypothetical protein